MSEKIVIDLTENIAHAGSELHFEGEYSLPDDLLPYPNSALDKVAFEATVTFTNPNVLIDGAITCFVSGFCDRCLERVTTQIELPFKQIFFKDSGLESDDYVYFNSLLDATKAVSDEIVLSMPISLLCKDDCKGLCPKCGRNLNNGTCDCDSSKENPFSILKNLKF
ncbi:MAG: DUF177 domain-containing protein [Corallococcus sp.]|nr:DUF177 domain-containing protein [Bacillota bacterium]MCM1534170.1 DUF177 domain-containing protein [Corallococcus sp.]